MAETAEAFPASAKLVDCYEKWSMGKDHASEEPNHNAWCLANNSDLPIWDALKESGNAGQAKRFTKLMDFHHSSTDLKHTLEKYDWKKIDGTIVDIGGSEGELAVTLADTYPHLPHIIEEDLESKVSKGETTLPPKLQNRVYFIAHDFFHPHPEAVISAKLFILRFVLCEYSEKYARRILRNLSPALQSGGTLLIVDVVLPPISFDSDAARALQRMDMTMMQLFNGRERDHEDWAALSTSVDTILKIVDFKNHSGSILGFMEVVYDG